MGDKNPKAISKQASHKQSKADRIKQRRQEAILAKQPPEHNDKNEHNDKKR